MNKAKVLEQLLTDMSTEVQDCLRIIKFEASSGQPNKERMRIVFASLHTVVELLDAIVYADEEEEQ